MSKNNEPANQTKVYICNECRDGDKQPCVLVVHLGDDWHGEDPGLCPYGRGESIEADWKESD